MIQGFGLSPQQRRLWQLQQDASSPFGVRCAAEITGVDRGGITSELEKAVERHEILRTSFPVPPDMTLPLQVIAESAAPDISDEDLTALAPQDQRQRLEALFSAAGKPWNFASGPLLRATICALSSRCHVLILETPALLADELAMERLVGEIVRGKGVEEEPIQYADLSQWLNEILESEETQAGTEYWQKQDLSSMSDVHLPLGRWSPHSLDFRPEAISSTLPAARVRKIDALCRDLDVDRDSWLLALWLILLARWTGRNRRVVGVTLDGRDYEELADAVGAIARSLPLSLEVRPNEKLAAFVRRTAGAVRGLGEWQQYFSWEALSTQEARSTEEARYCPFGFELPPAPDADLGIVHRGGCFEPFLVKLRGEERQDGGLDLLFHFDSSCLTADETQRLAESWDALLSSAARGVDTATFDLDLISEAERRGSSAAFSVPSLAATTVHEAFEQQVASRPGAMAVQGEDAELTYGELDIRAERLARRLRALGADPESRVAICLERSAEMVVAMLAVLKSGAAYVPLDPSLPARRLIHMLEDSSTEFLVSWRALLSTLPELPARPVLLDEDQLDEDQDPPDGGRGAGLAVSTGNLAYVIYTSGSTGRPKGVAIEHRHVLAYVDGLKDRIPIEPGLSFAMVSTFAADLGLTSVFGSLLTGGALRIVPQDRTTDPRSLAEFFERHPIDVLKIVPSHLRALLDSERPEALLPRTFLVLGGERLDGDLVATVAELAPSCRVFNHYGPTEATVGASAFPVDTIDPAQPIPLGRGLRHCQLEVLSERLREVPTGIAGELAIGGAALARGYFGAPALTAEKFVPQPLDERPGERLYKTGDLARRRADRLVEYLGRVDQQVKIRGYRIELGEVEAVLREHSEVRQTVAVIRAGRLVAYVVPEDPSGAKSEALRGFLKDQLPDYMVPAFFVRLEELPLTANGKVDHQALPEPEDSGGPQEPSTALRTPVEEQLGSIWAELLGIARIGPDDNFFELGGHSLLAMQLGSRVREVFGLELPLGRIFDASNLEVLAREIENAMASSAGRRPPPLEAAPGEKETPLSFAQERHWILQQVDPESPLYNMPGALRISGGLGIEALRASFREVLRRHQVLRSAFPTVDGNPVQRVEEVPEFFGPLVDLGGVPEDAKLAVAQACVSRLSVWPFDLERAPMFRVILLRLAEDDHVMVVLLHHIVADRWTLGLLMRELSALYPVSTSGEPSPLPPLELQYADFARWQRQWFRGEVLDEEVAFWRDELAGAPPVLELNIARPRPDRLSAHGSLNGRSRRVPLTFSPRLSEGLEHLSRLQNATLFQTLLAAYQTLLHAYSGETDIVVGAPIGGRPRLETEGLIGCFINALALRGRLNDNPTFEDFLTRVRKTVLRAYTHQELPFERLVKEINPDRGGAATPIFQVVFTFANEVVEPAAIPGLDLSVWDWENTLEGKYDLILTLVNSEQGIQGFFAYNLGVFDSASIGRLAETFELLLHRLVENPGLPLDELAKILSTEDRRLRMDSAKGLMASRRGKLAQAKGRRKPDRKTIMEVPI